MPAFPQRTPDPTDQADGAAAPSRKAGGPAQYLAFLVGAETLAIEILAVREIIEQRPLTRVPTLQHWIGGVINVRGAAVPVIDLSLRLGRPESPLTRRTCFVVIECGPQGHRRHVGLRVDAVRSVLDIAPRDIEPVPAFGSRLDPAFVNGIGKVQGTFVKLLNVDAIVGETVSLPPTAG